MNTGRVYKIETMGLLDGPGIRSVFFLEGCPLRCSYCHNPESQTCRVGTPVYTADEVVRISKKYMPYYKRTGGGVTFSGGEPLLQGEFLIETLKTLKKQGIHTAIDTSGIGNDRYHDEVLKNVDLVILDVKAFSESKHRALTGVSLSGLEAFIAKLTKFKGQIWIRHVMLPGATDSTEAMDQLLEIISPLTKLIEKIEILPYHKLGDDKYSQLEIKNTLLDMPEMDKKIAKGYEIYAMCALLNKRKQCLLTEAV